MRVETVARGSPGAPWFHSRSTAYSIEGKIGQRVRDPWRGYPEMPTPWDVESR